MSLKEAADRPKSRERLYEWQRLQRVANGNVGQYDRDQFSKELARDLREEIFGNPDTKVMDVYFENGRRITPEIDRYWDELDDKWNKLDLKTRDEMTAEDARKKLNEIANNPGGNLTEGVPTRPSVLRRLKSFSNRFRGASRSEG